MSFAPPIQAAVGVWTRLPLRRACEVGWHELRVTTDGPAVLELREWRQAGQVYATVSRSAAVRLWCRDVVARVAPLGASAVVVSAGLVPESGAALDPLTYEYLLTDTPTPMPHDGSEPDPSDLWVPPSAIAVRARRTDDEGGACTIRLYDGATQIDDYAGLPDTGEVPIGRATRVEYEGGPARLIWTLSPH